MKLEKLTADIQNALGVSKLELMLVLTVLFGLLSGYVIKIAYGEEDYISPISRQELINAVDSLSIAEKSEFIGSDSQGNYDVEIAKLDTVKRSSKETKKKDNNKITSGKININSADKEELMRLPGIGESTALKIIEYRKVKKFAKPEDIMNVKGIGEKKFQKMKDFIEI